MKAVVILWHTGPLFAFFGTRAAARGPFEQPNRVVLSTLNVGIPMRVVKRLVILSALTALTGCVSARATLLTPNRHAPVPANDVYVYLQADEVPSGCERVALIHAEGDASATNEQQMIAAARKRAGKVGANAILIDELRNPRMGTRVAAEVFGLPADRKGQMIAFRCPDPASATATTDARTSAREP